jgi:predicted outer membrane repeat protein
MPWLFVLASACSVGEAGIGFEYAPHDGSLTGSSNTDEGPGEASTDEGLGEASTDEGGNGPLANDPSPPSFDDGRELEGEPAPRDGWDCAPGQPPFEVDGGGVYDNLSQAVAATPPGGTVRVCPGDHFANVIVDRPMTLLGQDPETTILDGELQASVLFIDAVDFMIQGFTIRRGKASVALAGDSLPCGGGMAVAYRRLPQKLSIRDLLFEDNFGDQGGALCIDGDASAGTDATLESVRFENNHASVNGGALLSRTEVEMIEVDFLENGAGGLGGAMHLTGDFVSLTGGRVHSNFAAAGGGGAYLQHPSSLEIASADWGVGPENENAPSDLACASASISWLGNPTDAMCWSNAFDECACQ